MLKVIPVEDRERGFVMVVVVVVVALVGSLGAIAMTSGNHASITSGRGRSWEQALHVAEAGADVGIARLQQMNGIYTSPLTITGETSQGNYSVVVTAQARNRHLVTATGAVPGPSGLAATRRVSFVLAPPLIFRNALFSLTSIDTKNNDYVVGDVWANANVLVEAGDTIEGSVTAATGWVWLYGGSRVMGSVQTGGYHPTGHDAIRLENNAIINGDGTASVTSPLDANCSGEPQNRYTIRLELNSRLEGAAKTWGTVVSNGFVGGPIAEHICTAAPAALPMPSFVYNQNNYDPATLHVFGTPDAPTADARLQASAWIAANKGDLHGTIVVFQSGGVSQADRLDLSDAILTEDVTLVTNLPIYSAVLDDVIPDHDAVFVLASFYQPESGTQCDVNHDDSDCSIHLKNGAQVSSDVALLAYAPYGPVAIKNNAEQFGAVYGQNIQIKNNQTLTYDARIERLVGFGAVTLEPSEWREVPPT
ncbi:MAG: hypothetical protein ACRDJM_06360 [Actinomycetota bacterium]